jgi:ATP-dependent Clp protease ATP-binding subunit ClpA
LLQRELENPLAVKLLAGELHDGDSVRVDVKDGSLTIEAA